MQGCDHAERQVRGPAASHIGHTTSSYGQLSRVCGLGVPGKLSTCTGAVSWTLLRMHGIRCSGDCLEEQLCGSTSCQPAMIAHMPAMAAARLSWKAAIDIRSQDGWGQLVGMGGLSSGLGLV